MVAEQIYRETCQQRALLRKRSKRQFNGKTMMYILLNSSIMFV